MAYDTQEDAMQRLTSTYKGYHIELTPGGDYCASFSAEIRDPSGHVSHLGTAGNSEERALERGREWIDFEEAFAPRQ